MTLDKAPEDVLREEQEREKDNEMPGTLGGEPMADPMEGAEQAQAEAEYRRDVERDREMVTEEPAPAAGLGLRHYDAQEFGIEGILNYNYWNCNGQATAIVAKEGTVADWAAYIGGMESRNTSEEDCVRWVCRFGAKLSRNQAHRWFPQLPIGAYRE